MAAFLQSLLSVCMGLAVLGFELAQKLRRRPQIVLACVGGAALVVFIYWVSCPSAEGLLEVASPTPAQIRTIASTLLVHDDFNIRAKASEKLTSLGRTAVPVLKDVALTHGDIRVRTAVLGLLAGLDANCAADLVVQMSQDSDAEVQRTAMSVAGQLDDPRGYDVLQQGLQSKDNGVRQKAVEGLGVRRDSRAVSALQDTMNDPNTNLTVRRHAARSLQLITGENYNNQIDRPAK